VPTEIAEVLMKYGVAGVAALSIAGNVFLIRHILKSHKEQLKEKNEQNEKRLKEKSEQNEIMLGMLEKRVETDTKHVQAFRSLKIVIEKLIEKL